MANGQWGHGAEKRMRDMTQRAAKLSFQRALLVWFRQVARDVPWRRTRDPYAILVSETILQQTRPEQAIAGYEKFVKALPTIEALAAASEDAVLKLWDGLGSSARARNLHKAAKTIVQDLGGRFPRTAAKWMELPGVNRFMAEAIASIAFNERVPILESNVKRVVARLFDVPSCIDDFATEDALMDMVDTLIPVRSPGDFNQAMIELGTRMCMASEARCDGCPMRKLCSSYEAKTQKVRPVTKPNPETGRRDCVVCVIGKDESFLLGRRGSMGLLPGLWEFPMAVVESGESHEQALVRAAKEAGVNVRPGELAATYDHSYAQVDVNFHAYRCRYVSGTPKSKVHSDLRWVLRGELFNFALSKPGQKLLRFL